MVTITLTSTPNDNSIQVPQTIGQSTNPIYLQLTSTTIPIVQSKLQVLINSVFAVKDGTTQPGRFLSSVTAAGSQIIIEIIFSNPFDKFKDFETVLIKVQSEEPTFNKTISFRTKDITKPTIENFAPSNLSKNNPTNTPIFIKILDQGSGIDINSINVAVNTTDQEATTSRDAIVQGQFASEFTGTLTSLNSSLEILISPIIDYHSAAKIQVTGRVEDNEQNLETFQFDFEILDIKPPQFQGLAPAANQFNVPQATTISFTISDLFGSGLNLSSLTTTINNLQTIKAGAFQSESVETTLSHLFLTYSSSDPTIIESAIVIIALKNTLPSSSQIRVSASINDNKGNVGNKNYYFWTTDYLAPWIENNFPGNLNRNVVPDTPIQFDVVDDRDGYATDLSSISVTIDGYSILNQTLNGTPVEGYFDGYLNQTFSKGFVDGYLDQPFLTPSFLQSVRYVTPTIKTNDGYIYYPGFDTIVEKKDYNRLTFKIKPLCRFDFNKEISYQIDTSDRGNNASSYLYYFYTSNQDTLITTAFPDSGTYQSYIDGYDGYFSSNIYSFLYETGVVLKTNFENTKTFYTIDGTNPQINSKQLVVGTTKAYSNPILLNKEGLNVIKFFSIDSAGNREPLKQEIYMIKSLPPQAETIKSIRITSDIPFPTFIIPVESTTLFKINQLITILDDKRPPITTKILSVNSTSTPKYLIVQDRIDKLKISRNARVKLIQQPLDTTSSIHIDTTQLDKYMYLGSDLEGKRNADSVFEQLRILNRASTDEEILADYTLLAKGTKLFNQQTTPSLPDYLSPLEKQRANLPNNTLVLLDFDGSIETKPRQLQLANSTIQIVDIRTASNDLIFTIKILNNENVDRQLLTSVLQNFAPTDLNVIVKYQDL